MLETFESFDYLRGDGGREGSYLKEQDGTNRQM